jgi:hypothetical protein
MLRIDSRNVNFNAASVIEDEVVAHFSANYNGGAEVYFNTTIVDLVSYNANAEVIEADSDEFKSVVIAAVNSLAI